MGPIKVTILRDMENRIFLCFGPPKSGTTFLQRTLNLHPEVSCPSEHKFNLLIDLLKQQLPNYNKALQILDTRTGGQGATIITEQTQTAILRAVIREIILSAANGKPIVGANDNDAIADLPYYDQLLDQPKMIGIFRNPIDRAISAWHHNLRLAEVEKDPSHRQMMMKYGGYDEWLVAVARMFHGEVTKVRAFSQQSPNILVDRI